MDETKKNALKIMANCVLVSAVESHGISYWAEVTEYDPDTTTATIVDQEADYPAPPPYKVTEEVILKGMRLITEKGNMVSPDRTKEVWFALAHPELDTWDIDSDIADCIVQAGVLGNVLYG